MKNVVFFIGTLKLGGTEAKLVRNFLPLLKERGRINPKLLLLQEKGEFLEELAEGIEIVNLEETATKNLIQIIPKFRKAVVGLKADIVVSCTWYPAIIAFLTRKLGFSRFRHVIHDTVNMTEYIKDEFASERFIKFKVFLFRKAYMNADAIIVNSHGIKYDFVNNFRIPGEKIYPIYNPFNKKMIHELSVEDPLINIDVPLIVSAGRLVYQKGFDILLKSFRKVRDGCQSKLLIIGDGKKKDELMMLAKKLHLQDDVIFLGFQKNPFKFMKKATVFCLATRYEGFPNVVLEAMTLGIPVVTTDCPSGPAEILDNGKYGILVPPDDPDVIADALMRVLSDEELRENLSHLSSKRAEDFALEASLKQWEDVILGI